MKKVAFALSTSLISTLALADYQTQVGVKAFDDDGDTVDRTGLVLSGSYFYDVVDTTYLHPAVATTYQANSRIELSGLVSSDVELSDTLDGDQDEFTLYVESYMPAQEASIYLGLDSRSWDVLDNTGFIASIDSDTYKLGAKFYRPNRIVMGLEGGYTQEDFSSSGNSENNYSVKGSIAQLMRLGSMPLDLQGAIKVEEVSGEGSTTRKTVGSSAQLGLLSNLALSAELALSSGPEDTDGITWGAGVRYWPMSKLSLEGGFSVFTADSTAGEDNRTFTLAANAYF